MTTSATGLDRIEKDFSPLKGMRIGLLVNTASVDKALRHAIDIFATAPGLTLAALFGPQHGMWAETQDNMVEWEGSRDKRTGLPTYSLYGTTRAPLPDMLENIDCLVIDLPDVGARYYTFAWTMLLCLEACKKAGISCFVLDRPNPLNGAVVEGPLLDPAYASFVGLHPISIRHGMTLGELARYYNEVRSIHADLVVLPLEGWRREMWFDDTALPWVMPSPNMPTLDTAIVYPGMCLLEGTMLSEGRGTTRPFEIFGSPFVDPYGLVESLEKECLPGLAFRPLQFIPTFQKHQGSLCGGAQIHVIDRTVFRPVLTGVAAIRAMYCLNPDKFGWKPPPYEYEEEKLPIDILAGSDKLRLQIEQGSSLEDIAQSWKADEQEFLKLRKPYLLY